MTEDDTRVAAIVAKLQERAVYSGDGFRQWVYPRLPKSYAVGPEVYRAVRECVAWGMTTNAAAAKLIKDHG